MIEIAGLEKRFGPREVLKGIDTRIESGRVTAIVGPNGAGKTTLIKCLLGLTRPDAGTIEIDGHRLNGDWAYRSDIGYMPQAARFPENLSAREVIRMLKDLRGNPEALDEGLLHTFTFADGLDKPIRTLSGGTRQKVSAVIAFLFRPKILILDEPTAGLDPIASSRLKDRIVEAKEGGKTVILTSHIMSEIEELSDHIIFLLEGRIRFEGPKDEIKAVTGEERLERAIAALLEKGTMSGKDGLLRAVVEPYARNGHAAVIRT